MAQGTCTLVDRFSKAVRVAYVFRRFSQISLLNSCLPACPQVLCVRQSGSIMSLGKISHGLLAVLGEWLKCQSNVHGVTVISIQGTCTYEMPAVSPHVLSHYKTVPSMLLSACSDFESICSIIPMHGQDLNIHTTTKTSF